MWVCGICLSNPCQHAPPVPLPHCVWLWCLGVPRVSPHNPDPLLLSHSKPPPVPPFICTQLRVTVPSSSSSSTSLPAEGGRRGGSPLQLGNRGAAAVVGSRSPTPAGGAGSGGPSRVLATLHRGDTCGEAALVVRGRGGGGREGMRQRGGVTGGEAEPACHFILRACT